MTPQKNKYWATRTQLVVVDGTLDRFYEWHNTYDTQYISSENVTLYQNNNGHS